MGTLHDEGRRRVQEGDHEQGILLFQIHLRSQPGALDTRKELRRLVRRHSRPVSPQTQRAIARAARALAIDLARPLEDLPRCEQLLECDPDCIPALIRLGQAALRGGLKEVGMWSFKDALRLSPRDPEVLIALIPFCTAPRDCFVLGRALYTQNLCAQAIGPLRRAAATIPFAARAGFLLGQCLLKLGKADDAVSALRRARRDEPHGSSLWNDVTYLLARIPDQAGSTEQATQHYRELAECGSERSLFALAERTGSLRVMTDLRPAVCDRRAVEAVPGSFAKTYRVCPIEFENGALVVALADPVGGGIALDDLRFMLNQDVVGAVADPEQVDATIQALYPVDSERPSWPWEDDPTPLVACEVAPPVETPSLEPQLAREDLPGSPPAVVAIAVAAPPAAFAALPPRPAPLTAPAPARPRRRWFTAEGLAAAVSAAATFLVVWALILQLGLVP